MAPTNFDSCYFIFNTTVQVTYYSHPKQEWGSFFYLLVPMKLHKAMKKFYLVWIQKQCVYGICCEAEI